MHLFSEFQEIWEMGGAKKCYQFRANFFWADGTGPGSIGGLAVTLSSKRSKSRAKSIREADCVRWISHFRPCSFWTVGTLDLAGSTGNDGPGGHKHPSAPGSAPREPSGILIKLGIDMSIRTGISFEW